MVAGPAKGFGVKSKPAKKAFFFLLVIWDCLGVNKRNRKDAKTLLSTLVQRAGGHIIQGGVGLWTHGEVLSGWLLF